MPSVRQLEYLVHLSDLGHFRRAAERAGVSQPTLSAQLAALEEKLNVQLVERSRSRVILTPAGQAIEQVARTILQNVTRIREIAASEGDAFSTTIRLGLPTTIGPYLLPSLVPQMHRAHPDLKLHVREEVPEKLPRSLDEGRHDIIIAPLPVEAKEFESVALYREPLLLALPLDHPLAAKEKILPADLRKQPVLTLETGHQLREQVEVMCESFGATLRTEFEGTSLETLRQMVAMGMGVAFLPGLYTSVALKNDRSIKTVPISGRAINRSISMFWRRTSTRSSAYKQLAGEIRNIVRRRIGALQVLD